MAVKYLKDFSEISGLQCNLDKTSVIPIGQEMDITDDNILCPDLELSWETELLSWDSKLITNLKNSHLILKNAMTK